MLKIFITYFKVLYPLLKFYSNNIKCIYICIYIHIHIHTYFNLIFNSDIINMINIKEDRTAKIKTERKITGSFLSGEKQKFERVARR